MNSRRSSCSASRRPSSSPRRRATPKHPKTRRKRCSTRRTRSRPGSACRSRATRISARDRWRRLGTSMIIQPIVPTKLTRDEPHYPMGYSSGLCPLRFRITVRRSDSATCSRSSISPAHTGKVIWVRRPEALPADCDERRSGDQQDGRSTRRRRLGNQRAVDRSASSPTTSGPGRKSASIG